MAVDEIATNVYRWRLTVHGLLSDLLDATNAPDAVLSQVRPLGDDRQLVTLSPQLRRDDLTQTDENLPDRTDLEAMEARLAVLEVTDAGLEVVDAVPVPVATRIRGIALDHAGDHLYVSHVGVGSDCAALEVYRFTLDLDPPALGSPQHVFTTTPCLRHDQPLARQQAGGRLVPTGDGGLLVSEGDFGLGPSHEAGRYFQPFESRPPELAPPATYGAVVHVDVAADNHRIVASGLRNPQGLALNPSTGRLWATDHGPAGGDEINLVVEGEDYDWPDVTYGAPYGTPLPEGDWSAGRYAGHHEGFARPRLAWVPSIAPSQLVVFDDVTDEFPTWAGGLLVGTLRDQSLRRLRLDGDRVVLDERIPIGHRVRDLAVDETGRLVVTSDEGSLVLLDLAPAPA